MTDGRCGVQENDAAGDRGRARFQTGARGMEVGGHRVAGIEPR